MIEIFRAWDVFFSSKVKYFCNFANWQKTWPMVIRSKASRFLANYLQAGFADFNVGSYFVSKAINGL